MHTSINTTFFVIFTQQMIKEVGKGLKINIYYMVIFSYMVRKQKYVP